KLWCQTIPLSREGRGLPRRAFPAPARYEAIRANLELDDDDPDGERDEQRDDDRRRDEPRLVLVTRRHPEEEQEEQRAADRHAFVRCATAERPRRARRDDVEQQA